MHLKNQNLQYQEDLERMNQELDSLNSRKAILDDEVAVSAVKVCPISYRLWFEKNNFLLSTKKWIWKAREIYSSI